MTFFDISRKMLKAGFYKYRLYFLCNLSATALFCCFAVISTNRTFMNASIVNSSISNNIYLPFFLSAVFLVFFSSCFVSGISGIKKTGIRRDVFSWHETEGSVWKLTF